MRPFLLMVLVAALGACGAAPASDAERARSVEGQVWSPYCPGRLLNDCTTQQSRELREQISSRIESGDSTEEVLAWVREEFGDQAVARPETSGTGLVIWLVPVAIFAVGALLVARVLRRRPEPVDQ